MISNFEKGRVFQLQAAAALAKLLGSEIRTEVKVALGSPPKNHAFDLATADGKYVGEAKAFEWTVSANIPSAKITTLREAIQHLQLLGAGTKGFLIMKRDLRPHVSQEALADYFVRLNQNLLGRLKKVGFASYTDNSRKTAFLFAFHLRLQRFTPHFFEN